MVAVQQDACGGKRCYVLRPDIGLFWRQTMQIYGLIVLTSLSVAVIATVLGYWPVLPFAGLELGLLGWALYVSARRGHDREVILIEGDRVEIQKGRREIEQRWVFEAYWTEVALMPSRHRWYPSRLTLRSRGEDLELGQFLRDEERADLALDLKRWIGPMAASGEGV